MSQLDIALVGMACVYPGAPDLDTFWRNIASGFDAITDLPPGRLDPKFYDPESTATDRIYARRGGFIDAFAQFDAAAFGVMPVTASTADPDQMLALHIAEKALADAGYLDKTEARERTSIILGRGGYIGAGLMRWVSDVAMADQLVQSLRDLLPGVGEAELARVKEEFQARTGVRGADTTLGIIPNLVASRVANRFDFGGSAYTIDAACASSLVAVDRACAELTNHEADMVLAGGVHVTDTLIFWSVFSQLGALSRSQNIRPFDRRADGLLIGEGIGMVVLKRLADAERDGDRIYAVIRGSGVASDGRASSLINPRVSGQVLALQRAWQSAELDPTTVGLIEAHGTATVAGDTAEIETLKQVFGPLQPGQERAGLGSVKSMIGHTMPAAGAAGLIKAALAVYHGVLPPTLHCSEAQESLEETRFRVIQEAEPWHTEKRRAAVNAFGFGGINAHVILDSHPSSTPARRRRGRPGAGGRVQMLALAGRTQAELIAALEGHTEPQDEGPWRIAIANPTPERLAVAKRAVQAGRERFGRDGIFFSPGGVITEGGKIAFLFPGIEAQFEPDVEEIAAQFRLTAPEIEDTDLLQQGVGVFLVNLLYERVIEELGLRPDVIAGHSIGEWSGMVAAGILDKDEVQQFIETTIREQSLHVPDVTYLAVGASAERAASIVAALPHLKVSHDNCVHQSILCGPDDEIGRAADMLRASAIFCEVLPFKSGFHSPAFEPYLELPLRLLEELEIRPPTVPLWSATTCEPYPREERAIRELFGEHLVKPVLFRQLILRLYDEGVRVFVQVSAGRLTSFVDDVLQGKRHLAVSLAATGVRGTDQLDRAAAELFVAGANLRLDLLGIERKAARHHPMRLNLATTLVRLETSLGPVGGFDLPAEHESPLVAEFARSMREMVETQREITQAFVRAAPAQAAPAGVSQTAAPPPAPQPSRQGPAKLSKRLSVETYPELMDHCLTRQSEDWPDLVDLRPTAPMTMLLELMAEAVLELHPGRVVTRIEQVAANTWLHVEPAVDLEISVTQVEDDRFEVKLGEYASGFVVVADDYPERPPPSTEALSDEEPVGMDVATAYRDHWLFHGPRYQGLKSLDAVADNGIRGRLTSLAAKGGLLDNAGQLYGLWIAVRNQTDRIGMPIRIRSVHFYEPEPAPGEVVDCRVWVRQLGSRLIKADMELTSHGRVCTRIEGWDDWRFETGGRMYPLYRYPELNILAQPQGEGFVVVEDPGWLSTTIDFLTKRILSVREREQNRDRSQSAHYTEWLAGRIAAKDAVRLLLFETGVRSLFPAQVVITSDEAGRPHVSTPTGRDIRVSLAHKKGIAVAIAAEGVTPGIDIERIEPRSDGFAAMAFEPEELALIAADQDRDAWITRLWSAKEAVGKAKGTGMSGNPKSLRVSRIEGESLLVENRWVDTTVLSDYIIAWTRK